MNPLDAFVRQMGIVRCSRCGVACAVRPIESHPDLRLLKRASTAEGTCASCAITAVIKATPVLLRGIEKNGVDILLRQDVQTAFGQVLTVGNSDAQLDDIDWARVVENWDKEHET